MIPLLPVTTHLDFARELTKQSTPENLTTPDNIDYVASRQFDLAPDPIFITVSRAWTRLTSLFHGTSRRPA
jgi:hypothetical protein